MPGERVNPELPQVKNVEIKDLQWAFNGAWIPTIDQALIGPENYSVLQNMRYRDNGLEGVSGYTKYNNATAITGYLIIRNGIQLRTNHTQETYVLVHAANSIGGQGRVYVNKTAVDSQGDFEVGSYNFDTGGNPYFEDVSSGLSGRFSLGPQGTVAYANTEEVDIWAGDEMRVAGAFSTDDATGANPKDHTDKFNNSLQTAAEEYTFNQADQGFMIILTTRPIQGIKFYLSSFNSTAGTNTVKYWDGTAFSAVSNPVDGTKPSTDPLAQTGTFSFDSTHAVAKPMHYEELYLYAYLVTLDTAVSADIYHITVNAPFQDVVDIWDGVYRQPIQFQVNKAGVEEDYTLHVNESSDTLTPIGADLKGLTTYTSETAGDYIRVMFEKPTAAIKMTMLSAFVNAAVATTVMVVKYWDGDSWNAVSGLVDGTISGSPALAFGKTGLVTWNPPTDEQPQTAYGTYGYLYDITITTTDISSDENYVMVDLCTGIPAQQTVQPFKFPAVYKNRVMLCNYEKGNERNRIDFSVNNAPDAWNGLDSSDLGTYSLYFGDDDPINAATQLYNRFGSNIFSMFLVLKQNSVYLMTGNDPTDFTLFPVSFTIGCPAPLSLAAAEVGFEVEGELARNVAIWCSHSGPVLFDGAILVPLKGIDHYFDPNDTDNYINIDYFHTVRGWVDSTRAEYNLLLPIGTDTTADTWVTYDLKRKKWFKRDTGDAEAVQTGFSVIEDGGAHHIFGGIDTGHVMLLDNGTSYDGTGIEQIITTGDIFLSNNIWDECRIRKFKLIAKKISEEHQLEINYLGNSNLTPGIAVIWEDTTDFEWTDTADFEWSDSSGTTLDLSLASNNRLIKLIDDLNFLGWLHGFQFTVTTDDSVKGFQPIMWGLQYEIERKDDTAS